MLFRKRLDKSDAKSVLEEILTKALERSQLNPENLFKAIIEQANIPLPSISIPELPDFTKFLAKILVSGISDENAYHILKEIKTVLSKYKL